MRNCIPHQIAKSTSWIVLPLASAIVCVIPVEFVGLQRGFGFPAAQAQTADGTDVDPLLEQEATLMLSDVTLRQAEANRLLDQGNEQLRVSQFREALASWQSALKIFQEIGDRAGEGRALGNLGTAYLRLSQYEQAIELFEQDLTIAREMGNQAGESRALTNLGVAYANLGQHQRAIGIFEQVLSIVREMGDRAGESAALGNLGSISNRLGQYQQAIDLFEQVLPIAQEIGDKAGEGRALGGLGSAYSSLGQYKQAIDFFERRLTIARNIGDRIGEGGTLGNLGIAYNRISQYQQAIELLEQSLFITQDIGNRSGEGIVLGNLGDIYNSLGQYQQAIDILNQSLAIAQEIDGRVLEGRTLGSLGNAYRNLGEYSQAIELYEQILDIAKEVGDRAGEGRALGNLAITYRNLGEYQQAIELYEQHLAIAQEIGDRAAEGAALGNLGITYATLGQHRRAIDLFEQDLLIAREIGNRASEGATLNNLGGTLYDTENLDQAEENLFVAVDILESIRSGGLPEDQRISLVDTQREAFQSLQRTLIAQDKISEALEVAERARASVFREELGKRLDPEAVAQDVLPVSINQIQQIAREKDATLVEYSIVLDEALYIWIVQPTGKIAFQQISLQEQDVDLLNSVELARESMGVYRSIVAWEQTGEPTYSNDSQQANQQLRQLHQLLIDPIVDLLPDTPDKSIILIPQDELFLVPFAALQDAEGTYLIDRHTILTAPSIATLGNTQELQQRVQQADTQKNLVIGNPEMPTLSIALGEPPIRLESLPGAEQEAVGIAALLNTEPLLGSHATKFSVVQQMPDARIIHLATHGILDEIQGLNGGVILAADGTGEFNDGLLTAAEIAQMDLNAELVVLSACNTGQGRITGDGVVGLSRSLILAGVPSVVVSLWAVPDAPTGELMMEFYRQLEQTGNKAQALRQAMLTIREQYPDPIAWAGFTLIGEAE